MTPHKHKAKSTALSRRTGRRKSLFDPEGLFLLFGSSAVLMAVALFKARGLPFDRSRDGRPGR